ncbi:hypothetical protein BKH41_02875 [Helicobacter sp. 12S02232-10]|uniref:hypothetical protein n=1 Tax=Helicobacter sp. 12S02232-10 TaxID=1476197 RepID=UPI000BA562FB|nr:hypothetical protein [Helicobacter sp. 12S02232-10]PAF49622.1 hypothetical protein BKH41_02875 [Helicobacter sp. 12S02232-10]
MPLSQAKQEELYKACSDFPEVLKRMSSCNLILSENKTEFLDFFRVIANSFFSFKDALLGLFIKESKSGFLMKDVRDESIKKILTELKKRCKEKKLLDKKELQEELPFIFDELFDFGSEAFWFYCGISEEGDNFCNDFLSLPSV